MHRIILDPLHLQLYFLSLSICYFLLKDSTNKEDNTTSAVRFVRSFPTYFGRKPVSTPTPIHKKLPYLNNYFIIA